MAMHPVRKLRSRILQKKWDRKREYLLRNADIMPSGARKFLASYYPDSRVRKRYLTELGVEFGEGSWANIGFLKIPPDTKSKEKVYIGKNVSIAANVVCICEANANSGREINTYPYVSERATRRGDIVIEDDAWIGANVTILPGLRIGRCAIVGAGSVVTRDIDSYGVYAGVPARKIRDVREAPKS